MIHIIDVALASPEAAEAAAEGAEATGVLASLGINSTLFLFQLVNFALVAAVLWFLILKPLSAKLTERQKQIEDNEANAKKLVAKLEKSEQDYQARLKEAAAEAKKIIQAAEEEGGVKAKEIVAKAKKEVEAIAKEAKRAIEAEKAAMIADFKSQAGELVAASLEKILKEKITDEKDDRLIKEVVSKIDERRK